jgi:Domain of unknown function (DUF4190)
MSQPPPGYPGQGPGPGYPGQGYPGQGYPGQGYPDPRHGQGPWAGPGYVGYATPAPPTSARATAAVVLGALSVMACMGFVTGIPAMIVGVSARREIRESQGRIGGDSVALGGIIAGAVGTVLSLLVVGLFVLLAVLGANIQIDDPSGPGTSTTSATGT